MHKDLTPSKCANVNNDYFPIVEKTNSCDDDDDDDAMTWLDKSTLYTYAHGTIRKTRFPTNPKFMTD